MTSEWLYQGEPFSGPTDIKEQFGFVYKITRKDTGKFYVGVKFLWKPKYNTVKGKKKKSMVESDYRTYWGSSEKLQADVKELGEDLFTREILEIVKYKGMCKYVEAKTIIEMNCLELSDDECYNAFIGLKLHKRCVRR